MAELIGFMGCAATAGVAAMLFHVWFLLALNAAGPAAARLLFGAARNLRPSALESLYQALLLDTRRICLAVEAWALALVLLFWGFGPGNAFAQNAATTTVYCLSAAGTLLLIYRHADFGLPMVWRLALKYAWSRKLPLAEPFLAHGLAHPSAIVRRRAAELAEPRHGAPLWFKVFERSECDPSPKVREACRARLEVAGLARAFYLQKAAAAPDPTERAAAAVKIRRQWPADYLLNAPVFRSSVRAELLSASAAETRSPEAESVRDAYSRRGGPDSAPEEVFAAGDYDLCFHALNPALTARFTALVRRQELAAAIPALVALKERLPALRYQKEAYGKSANDLALIARQVAETLRYFRQSQVPLLERAGLLYCQRDRLRPVVRTTGAEKYAVCPACGRSDKIATGVVEVVGIIGGKGGRRGDSWRVPLWDPTEARAVKADLDRVEIVGGYTLNYDWAVGAALTEFGSSFPRRVKLVAQPPLSSNTLRLLDAHCRIEYADADDPAPSADDRALKRLGASRTDA